MSEPRHFTFRAGVRLSGTTIACDPLRSANEVVFLSHAPFPGDRRIKELVSQRNTVRQLVATESTRLLLGKLDVNVLVCDYGRPFALGDLRLELIPSGYAPGAAALLCRHGETSAVYVGPLRAGEPVAGARETEVRPADAICIDATYGAPHFVFPPRSEGLALVVDFAQATLAEGKTAVILLDEPNLLGEIANALARSSIPARAHPHLVSLATELRGLRIEMPIMKRIASSRSAAQQVSPPCALLWPVHLRDTPALARIPSTRTAFVSGFAADAEVRARVGADIAVPVSGRAGYVDLLAYIRATGAREIATVRGHAEPLADDLRAQGYNAYSLGPPTQIPLFEPETAMTSAETA